MYSPISPWIVFFASILTSNMIFANFLGMCSFISVSGEFKTANGLGKAVTLVMAITSAVNWLIYHFVILPLEIDYLRNIVFIMVIAALVQILELFLDRYAPDLHAKLGIFLPLITVNCAILGAALFIVIRNYNFLQAVLFGLGSGLGWWLAIVMLAAIREKLASAKLPPGLQGPALTFIITGIMAMAFIGFSGIFQVQ